MDTAQQKNGGKTYRNRARIMKALAHPGRLKMLDELSLGERCVCELVELVGADFSTVSKHLALMREAGIVRSRREGVKIFYRLRVPCILKIFDCVEAVIEDSRRSDG